MRTNSCKTLVGSISKVAKYSPNNGTYYENYVEIRIIKRNFIS